MSQNFLVDRNAVERIADETNAASLPIVELGPGLGTLTKALLNGGQKVVAVEMDDAMIDVLKVELAGDTNFEVIKGDAASFQLDDVADGHDSRIAVAGNLPYAITGAVLRNVVQHRDRIGRAVLMVQREVYDRLNAEPGQKVYGALSVFVQAQFAHRRLCLLGPGSFHPPPSVQSAVITLTPHPVPRATETRAFAAVVRASFEQRRKTLRNALRAKTTEVIVDRALEITGIDGRRRGETLSVEEFAALAAQWHGG